MPFCPKSTTTCNDNTCLGYQNHTSCNTHTFHIGDRILNTLNNKYGHIYDSNPLKSSRSLLIIYDTTDKIEAIFGHNVCAYIQLTGDSRDLTRISQNYQ